MYNLTFTQEFFLCVVNDNGKLPDKARVCLLAGGISQLIESGHILASGKGKFAIGCNWENGHDYLWPIYDFLASSKKQLSAARIAESFSEKSYHELLSAFRISLLESGYADETTQKGFFGQKIRFVPKPEARDSIINEIRAELLENSVICDDIVYLAAMLDASDLLLSFFDKSERKEIKKRIVALRDNETYATIGKMLSHLDDMMLAMFTILMTTVLLTSND